MISQRSSDIPSTLGGYIRGIYGLVSSHEKIPTCNSAAKPFRGGNFTLVKFLEKFVNFSDFQISDIDFSDFMNFTSNIRCKLGPELEAWVSKSM